ncbi:MAG TPA: FAD-binding oxidoreductase [Rhizomicrobium sp.]|jgi:alkyldihydroxyacetonephosphate synthase|nr:FAD-binding oxidoreductase [Rhizomicrobium sp.]
MSVDRSKIRWNGWGWAAHADAVASREDVWAWLATEVGMPSLLATPARALEDVRLPESRLDKNTRAALAAVLGADRVRDDAYERAFHALGRSYHDLLRLRSGDIPMAPDAVLYPRGTEEVLALLAFASERGIAIVPYGGGTSVVGGVNARHGPFHTVLTLDLSGMNRVIRIDGAACVATVEGGIYGPALETALNAKGLTLGHFPQSFEFSTLGGWIAHRGAGQASDRYGSAKDWLIGARLATPRGLLDTGTFPASSAGPQLKDLVLGSEGIFGIVADATVRVRKAPAAKSYRGYLFRDFASGISAIRAAEQDGVETAMLRLSDPEETRFFRAFGRLGRERTMGDRLTEIYLRGRGFGSGMAALVAGFEGDPQTVRMSLHRFGALAGKLGGMDIGEGQGRRWLDGRFHGPYLRDPMMDRGLGVDTLETATSWSNIDSLYTAVGSALNAAMRETAPRAGAHGIVLCHISHSYPDGASLYFTYIFPRALDSEIEQWRLIKQAASDAIVGHGGTISHHHGVGEDHLPWMMQEKGALGIEVLRAVKRTLDPTGILNPGKLIPG